MRKLGRLLADFGEDGVTHAEIADAIGELGTFPNLKPGDSYVAIDDTTRTAMVIHWTGHEASAPYQGDDRYCWVAVYDLSSTEEAPSGSLMEFGKPVRFDAVPLALAACGFPDWNRVEWQRSGHGSMASPPWMDGGEA
jgi:hypothetical protein